MAIDAPLVTVQRLFAAKNESTTGTAEALADADGAFNMFDPVYTPDIPYHRRQGQSSASNLPGVTGMRSMGFTGRTQLAGTGVSGTYPLWATRLWLGSGFAQSGGVFTPETGGTSPVTNTIGGYEDGVKMLAAGMVFNAALSFINGQPIDINWNGLGVYQAPTDTALLTPTYPTTIPPRFAGAVLTIGGVGYKISTMGIAFNNVLTLRPDATKDAAAHAGVVVHRNIQVTVDPESSLLATKDWYSDWTGHVEAALSCIIGSATGNTFNFAAPKMQLSNVQTIDREGINAKQLTFETNRSAAAGDDEFSLTLS